MLYDQLGLSGDRMSELWVGFIGWVDALSPREAAILGAVGLVLLTGLGKYVILPFSGWVIKRLGTLLYPLLSGAVLIDRLWSLPRYLRNVDEYAGRLRNPWLEEGQRLTEIFVPVSAATSHTDSDRIDLKQVFAKYRRAVVVGEPGSGKSTGLKAIAIDCVNGRLRRGRRGSRRIPVPVYLELRRFAESGLSLTDYFAEVFKKNGFPKAERTIRRLSKRGELAYLLDALDEVDEEKRSQVIQEVRALIKEEDSGGKCRVILTSRPVGYSDQLRDLVDETFLMADFMPADIRKFIRNWQFRPPKSQERLLKILADQPPIQEICRNPLMLTIVTSLYKETDYPLPDSREEFFRICIDALLRRWDEAREMENRNKYPPGLKESFLQELAFQTLAAGYQPLNEASLLRDAEGFLTGRQQKGIDASRFLNEIIRSGLLGRLPTGEMYFAHKTLAESLAASYFRSRPADLEAQWSESPTDWLEVCSLLVSDHRFPSEQIERFLMRSRERGDWSDMLTLAGEAHLCPEKQRSWIVSEMLPREEIWENMSRRSIAGIARLGDEARETLTTMLRKGSDTVRRETIYALGLSRERWAIDLVVESLTDKWSSTAIDAVAGIGDDAITIIGDLIHSESENLALTRTCIDIALRIGSPESTEVILPLIWSQEETIRESASWVISERLSDQQHRNVFEAAGLASISQEDMRVVEKTMSWAVPWVEPRNVSLRARFSKLIDNLAKLIRKETSKALLLERLPAELMIPVLIQSGMPSQCRIRFLYSDPRWNEDLKLSRTTKACESLVKSTESVNRALWSKATGPLRPDLALMGQAASVFSFACLLLLCFPIAKAVISGYLSFWYLSSLIPIVILAVNTKENGTVEGLHVAFIIFGLVGSVVRLISTKWRRKIYSINELFIGIFMLVGGSALLATSLASVIWLGPLWAVCLVPSMVSMFFEVEPWHSITLVRRGNRLLALRLRLNWAKQVPKYPSP
jgi:hypothetical protein